MRHGGMRLHRLSPAEDPAAFLSSAALVNVSITGTSEHFLPFDGPGGAGLCQECSHPCRTHRYAVCLHTVLPQAQADTLRAIATSHMRSIAVLHNGSRLLKRAQHHKARMLSCTSQVSWIWLTVLPIHNALTLSNSAFRSAFQFRLGLSPRLMHEPRVRCGCGALVDPLQAHPSWTSFSTLKKAHSSPPHGLRTTMLSVELGARSCNPLGCPPHLSPTAQESRDPTHSPQLVTGRTLPVSFRTVFSFQMAP